MVVQDYFTKWVETIAMPDQTAETVATCLVDQVFARFGVCQQLFTDQGRNFESRVILEVARLLGIKKTYHLLPSKQ